ncbi:MAG: hypothetical protein ACTSV5_11200 [Promethearchaeota archaeon]
MKDLNEKIITTTLILLAIINFIFIIVSPYFGPIIGFVLALIVLVQRKRKKDNAFIIVIASIWILFHIYELITCMDCTYPIFLYLNLILPIPLLYCGIKEYISIKNIKD